MTSISNQFVTSQKFASAIFSERDTQNDTEHAAVIGNFQNITITATPNTDDLLQELSEEMGMTHGKYIKKTDEQKDISEFFQGLSDYLCARVHEVWQASDEEMLDASKKIDRALQFGQMNAQNFWDILENASGGDKSLALALLDNAILRGQLDHLFGGHDNAIKNRLNFVKQYETRIQAGINTIEIARAHAIDLHSPVVQLQKSYQDQIDKRDGLHLGLIALVNDYGVDGFQRAVAYLEQASASDINARRSSLDNEKIRSAVNGLQLSKLFHQIFEELQKILGKLKNRAFVNIGQSLQLDHHELTKNVINMLDKPSIFEQKIAPLLADKPLMVQIPFLTDIFNLIKNLPDYLVGGNGAVQKLLIPMQVVLDQTASREDEGHV